MFYAPDSEQLKTSFVMLETRQVGTQTSEKYLHYIIQFITNLFGWFILDFSWFTFMSEIQ